MPSLNDNELPGMWETADFEGGRDYEFDEYVNGQKIHYHFQQVDPPQYWVLLDMKWGDDGRTKAILRKLRFWRKGLFARRRTKVS